MTLTFDPDGGELGRATIKPVTALELQLLIPHIASILSELAESKLSHLPFKYAFEVHVHERDAVKFVIRGELPPHVHWYEVDGTRLFEMRGPSGGLVTSYICYLITI